MANYQFTYQCGHETTGNFTGSPEKRQSKIDAFQAEIGATVCPRCQLNARIAEARTAGDDALVAELVHQRNVQNGRKGMKALQNKYSNATIKRITGHTPR